MKWTTMACEDFSVHKLFDKEDHRTICVGSYLGFNPRARGSCRTASFAFNMQIECEKRKSNRKWEEIYSYAHCTLYAVNGNSKRTVAMTPTAKQLPIVAHIFRRSLNNFCNYYFYQNILLLFYVCPHLDSIWDISSPTHRYWSASTGST